MMKAVLAKTFGDVLKEHMKELGQIAKRRAELEAKVLEAKKEEQEKGRELNRLNRIAYLAGFSRNVMEWHLAYEHGKRQNMEWTKIWCLETSIYNFSIFLSERNDLKRDKWEVMVKANKLIPSEKPKEIHGGYTYYEYGPRKYMERDPETMKYKEIPGQEMHKKFKSLEEAMAFVEFWKEKLYEDHKEDIDYDRKLRELCIQSGYTLQ